MKAIVWPVATYGCESWTLQKNEEICLQAFEIIIIQYLYSALKSCKGYRGTERTEKDSACFVDSKENK